MREEELLAMLKRIENKEIAPTDALKKLRSAPFEDLGYAMVDHHRALRQGMGEVIYAASKSKEQIYGIVKNLAEHDATDILVTRLTPEKASILLEDGELEIRYNETANIAVVNPDRDKKHHGSIVIASGGTSDIPVCEEAAITAETLGSRVNRLYDVGVAGLHRILSHLETLQSAQVIIAVAGMEGALPSVIGGLVNVPVIAVPTSVGYGANFEGLAALLAMLNSCASGIATVNIDNGFGAGVIAHRINSLSFRETSLK